MKNKLKKYQKNRFLDILDPAGLRAAMEKFLKHLKSLRYPLETLQSYSTTEVNGWRQKLGVDAKFASKLDFTVEALVAYSDLRPPGEIY